MLHTVSKPSDFRVQNAHLMMYPSHCETQKHKMLVIFGTSPRWDLSSNWMNSVMIYTVLASCLQPVLINLLQMNHHWQEHSLEVSNVHLRQTFSHKLLSFTFCPLSMSDPADFQAQISSCVSHSCFRGTFWPAWAPSSDCWEVACATVAPR